MDEQHLTELHQAMTAKGDLPSELYKYTKISESLYKTLINSELWFASPLTFNDPFDCQINDKTNWTQELIEELIEEYINEISSSQEKRDVILKSGLTPEKISKIYKEASKKILSQNGITCFTDNPYNLLMWAHYADSHKGICLKFDTTKHPELFKTAVKVKYSEEYPEFDYLKDRKKDKKELFEKNIQTKSSHWEYEQEIRVITLRKVGLSAFKKESLKEIIFGCKIDEKEIKTIKKIINDSLYSDIKFKQVKLKDFSFSIDIVDIYQGKRMRIT